MLSARWLKQLRDDLLSRIHVARNRLADMNKRDLLADGSVSPAEREAVAQRDAQLESDLLNVVNAELGPLAAEGQLNLLSSPDLIRSEEQQTGPSAKAAPTASSANQKRREDHRRGIIKAYKRREGLTKMEAVARRLGVDASALYGMTRDDRSRYAIETLESVLKTLGCTKEQWDHPEPQ
jgi:hypothetical protein